MSSPLANQPNPAPTARPLLRYPEHLVARLFSFPRTPELLLDFTVRHSGWAKAGRGNLWDFPSKRFGPPSSAVSSSSSGGGGGGGGGELSGLKASTILSESGAGGGRVGRPGAPQVTPAMAAARRLWEVPPLLGGPRSFALDSSKALVSCVPRGIAAMCSPNYNRFRALGFFFFLFSAVMYTIHSLVTRCSPVSCRIIPVRFDLAADKAARQWTPLLHAFYKERFPAMRPLRGSGKRVLVRALGCVCFREKRGTSRDCWATRVSCQCTHGTARHCT